MTTSLIQTTPVPQAVLLLLCDDKGQLRQRFNPGPLMAAAEVAELLAVGAADIIDGKLVPQAIDRASGIPAAAAPTEPVSLKPWMARRRRAAVSEEQAAAVDSGLLRLDRGKLLGVMGYDKHLPDAAARDRLTQELTDARTDCGPRAALLARLLVQSKLVSVLDTDSAGRQQVETLARSQDNPQIAQAISSMDVALATVAFTTLMS